MSTTFDRHGHPVLACADTIGNALKETADVPVTLMDPADKRAALLALTRLEAQGRDARGGDRWRFHGAGWSRVARPVSVGTGP